MTELGGLLIRILQNVWQLLALAIAVTTTLLLMANALKATASTAIGASFSLAQALGAGLATFLLAVFAFYLVPALVRGILQAYADSFPTCSQGAFFTDATILALQLFVAIGAVRMLKAIFTAIIMSAAGGSGGIASALLEIAEIIAAALLLTIIVPLIQASLGAC